jgi:hypothetical protein
MASTAAAWARATRDQAAAGAQATRWVEYSDVQQPVLLIWLLRQQLLAAGRPLGLRQAGGISSSFCVALVAVIAWLIVQYGIELGLAAATGFCLPNTPAVCVASLCCDRVGLPHYPGVLQCEGVCG